ncbi:MAG: plastocyanin/azurin family copper-binding protein [Actinomycetota bacterium]
MRSAPLRRGLAVALAAVALAACVPASAGQGGHRVVHVRIHYSRFEPAAFDFEPGQTVTFVVENTDPIDHEFLLGDEGVQLAHERGTEAYHPPRPGEMTVEAGATATTTYTFAEPGEVLLGCHLPGHYAYGMRGIVTVG